jgi:SAM-dependent methyltransferase
MAGSYAMIEALGIAMVKNEADIIEAFVRHNLGFVDVLVIADNDSVDGTREILVQLRQEGLPVVLFDDPIVAHFQAEKVTALYRRVVPEFKPRFVFLLDADEFVVAPSRGALYLQLRAMQPGVQAQYYWRTYIPAPTSRVPDISDPLREITHRRANEEPWPKSIIVRDPTLDTKLKVEQGNHGVICAGKPLPVVKLRDVVLAHFPVRSIDQATSKALVGWITNLERNRRRPNPDMGFHKKLMYGRIVHGPGITPEDLTREALKYAQNPESEFTKLKWPEGVVCEPVIPGYATLTVQPTIASTPLLKVVRCVDKILNPEANSSDSLGETEFLRSLHKKAKTWRDFVPPLIVSGKRQAAYMRSRRARADYLDLPPFRYLAERDCPTSVLDIGCGSGAYLKYFASQGAQRIRGMDGIDEKFGYLQPDEYTRFDHADRLDLAETFDLVICMSMIPNGLFDSEEVLVNNIARHASKRIVFSSALLGQSVSGRVSSRPVSYWLDLFESAGWYPCLFDTLALRSLSTFPWFRSGLLVLTHDRHDAIEARDHLVELEKRRTKWRVQRPAVITHTFAKTASKLPKERGPLVMKIRAVVKNVRGYDIRRKWKTHATSTA